MDNLEFNKKRKTYFKNLRHEYRDNLRKIGLSPDEHLERVDFNHLPFFMDKKPILFLKNVTKFYDKLDPLEKLIFVNEYLEKGRHGDFWWLYYFRKEDFKRVVIYVGTMFMDEFGGDHYDVLYKA